MGQNWLEKIRLSSDSVIGSSLGIIYVFTFIASVDVDRIAKEMDFQVLQQNIMNVTFCNIETEVI